MTTVDTPQKTGASVQFIADTFQIRRTYWFGPNEVKDTFGVEAAEPTVPELFSESVLRRAWRMDCCVVQQVAAAADGKPLTLKCLHDTRNNADFLGGKFLYNIDWYKELSLYTGQTPRPGLFLKGRSVIPDSNGKTFVGESLVAAGFVQRLFGDELPEQYGTAIEELRAGADKLEKLCAKNWKEGAQQCVALAFSRFFREPPVEALYRVLLVQKVNDECLFADIYTRTNTLSLGGSLVVVGSAGADGADLSYWDPRPARDNLGFSFSCSGELESVG